MRKTLFTIILIASMLASCEQKDQNFIIKDDQIGLLHKGAFIKQVDSIFAQDSIVSSSIKAIEGYQNEVEVFDKDGNQLMVLSPKQKDRKSTRLNSSHVSISYAVFCL